MIKKKQEDFKKISDFFMSSTESDARIESKPPEIHSGKYQYDPPLLRDQ
jgi:hypothetical protein